MPEIPLTPNQFAQFLGEVESDGFIIEPVFTEVSQTMVYEPIQIVFQPMEDDDTPYFE